MATASNESSGGTKTLTHPRPRAAIVAPLTLNGTIIDTGTEPYRLTQTILSGINASGVARKTLV
ncbi:hypothetical protein ACWCQ1_50650 [Streptomyces sp. NPDC002144]